MALFKLEINTIERTNLFYNKFCYKINIYDLPLLYRLKKSTNITDYLLEVELRHREWEASKNKYPHGWYRNTTAPKDIDIARIEKLILLMQKYDDKSQVMYRREHRTLIAYTNELDIIEEFAALTDSSSIATHISVSPEGVMFFKRPPPAKYRAYVTNNTMPDDFKASFIEYLERTPDIKISSSFHNYFIARYRRLWDRYYIDYNDEKNLMMIMLMFPGLIGKKYKLEKK